MEIEINGDELTKLMELLTFHQNDDFAGIDNNLFKKRSSDNVAMI